MPDAITEILDRNGNRVSINSELTDRYGFFVKDIKKWAQRPEKIVISVAKCKPEKQEFNLVDRTERVTGCAHSDPDSATDGAAWSVSCTIQSE